VDFNTVLEHARKPSPYDQAKPIDDLWDRLLLMHPGCAFRPRRVSSRPPSHRSCELDGSLREKKLSVNREEDQLPSPVIPSSQHSSFPPGMGNHPEFVCKLLGQTIQRCVIRVAVTQIGFLTIAVLWAGATMGQDDAAKKDLAKFQGTWSLVSGEVKGEKMPEEIVNNATNVIEGNKHTVYVGNDSIIGTHVMDSTKTPKEIESTDTAGPFKGQKYLGIYQFENGVSTVCFAAPGKDRTKEFTTKSGTGELMHVWKKK
jgi:uncharacterized protein (TIGR03067 family)